MVPEMPSVGLYLPAVPVMPTLRPPKRSKITLEVYQISGSGTLHYVAAGREFGAPPDMLRYDGAFQHIDRNGVFRALIAIATYSMKGYGQYRGRVTEGRWSSFSVSIRRANDYDAVGAIMDMRDHPENWITYRATGPNYELVPVTFKAFQEEV